MTHIQYLLTTETKRHHDHLVVLIDATAGLRVINPMPGSIQIAAEGTEDAWGALRAIGALDGVDMARNEPVAWLEDGE